MRYTKREGRNECEDEVVEWQEKERKERNEIENLKCKEKMREALKEKKEEEGMEE